MRTQIQLGDIHVDVIRKNIRNVHLSVHPPTGRVRVAAPERMSLDTVRVFVIAKLPWIKKQQGKLREQERETPREYIERESHYVWGKRYLLKVVEADQPASIELNHDHMILRLRQGTGKAKRQAIVEEWHRELLRKAVPPLIDSWERSMGVTVQRFFVQRMKTKWGSCNYRAGTIRLNTDLAKKPRECLEYIVVHEMAKRYRDRATWSDIRRQETQTRYKSSQELSDDMRKQILDLQADGYLEGVVVPALQPPKGDGHG